MNTTSFENELRKQNYAENTIVAYKYAVREFYRRSKAIGKENLLQYRTWLVENHKPKTVNQRIRGVNKYLDFIGRSDLAIKMVKVPKSSFLDNTVSNEDYEYFKGKLRGEDDLRWYYIVWTLTTTGARISELVRPSALIGLIRMLPCGHAFFSAFTASGMSLSTMWTCHAPLVPHSMFLIHLSSTPAAV